MEVTPHSIYQQAIDKQRVVIIGSSKSVIGGIISHVLKYHKRKFDYVPDRQAAETITLSDAPVVFIETNSPHMLDYHHHIGVMSSDISADPQLIEGFCNATPKSGILIYPESDAKLKSLAAKERADVNSISYKTYQHEQNGNGVSLISSTKEKVPVKISGAKNMESVSAAKEVLKKIGITSNQFYQAIASFELK